MCPHPGSWNLAVATPAWLMTQKSFPPDPRGGGHYVWVLLIKQHSKKCLVEGNLPQSWYHSRGCCDDSWSFEQLRSVLQINILKKKCFGFWALVAKATCIQELAGRFRPRLLPDVKNRACTKNRTYIQILDTTLWGIPFFILMQSLTGKNCVYFNL